MPILVIKCVMTEPVCRMGRRGTVLASRISVIVALTLSSLWMVATYTLAGVVLYARLPAALASVPGLLMEGIVNGIIAFFLLPFLREQFP